MMSKNMDKETLKGKKKKKKERKVRKVIGSLDSFSQFSLSVHIVSQNSISHLLKILVMINLTKYQITSHKCFFSQPNSC